VLPASERVTPWLRHVDKSPSVAAALPDEGSGEQHAATVTTRLTTTPASAADAPVKKPQPKTGIASRRRFLAAVAGGSAALVLAAAAVALVLVNRDDEEASSTPPSTNIVYHPAAQSAVVTTLAGTSSAGLRDGPGDRAEFPGPVDVAVDNAGMVYVVDATWIRRISPAGVVTTLAGSEKEGFVDGPSASARFDNPRGIAVDGAGTLYIADGNNHRIRTISPDGLVRTLAGNGTPGFADGPGGQAQFNYPSDVAVDAAGIVFVADALNNRIRRIARDSTVTTLAGDGAGKDLDAPGQPALFSFPRGVAVDVDGTVYVADSYNARIRAISPSGDVRTVAGSSENNDADGPAKEASFRDPFALAVDRSGNLYVLDKSSRVRLITSDGKVTTLAGSADTGAENGAGNDAQFDQPMGIAVGADGKVYIADTENHKIRLLRWSP
jgi:sugar lactone lactonase YvrE